MTSLVELEGVDLGIYASPPTRAMPFVPISLRDGVEISAEATNLALSLVAMKGDRIADERPLHLAVRLSIDGVTHLWSEDGALTAAVAIDESQRTLTIGLQFNPTGKSAMAAYADAKFLQALTSASSVRLRLPNGLLLPEVIASPEENLRLDDSSVRFLELISDVASLARVDLYVPTEVDEEVIRDLLMARKILRGQEVRGTWKTATMRLRPEGLETIRHALGSAEKHQFLYVSTATLKIGDQEIPLGEIRQHIPEAEVAGLTVDADEVVLSLVAPGGEGKTVISPNWVPQTEITPEIVLPAALFDALLADLDAPPRPSPLRDLL